MIDLKHIDEQLAKAKEDVAFWEKARVVFLDPRISQVSRYQTIDVLPAPAPVSVVQRPYGELKRKVFDTLPEWGIRAGLTTANIVERLTGEGYVFVSKTPAVSVNEALVTLEVEGKAFMFEKVGNTRYWTKAQAKPAEDHHD